MAGLDQADWGIFASPVAGLTGKTQPVTGSVLLQPAKLYGSPGATGWPLRRCESTCAQLSAPPVPVGGPSTVVGIGFPLASVVVNIAGSKLPARWSVVGSDVVVSAPWVCRVPW